MDRNRRFSDRVAVVTGAGSGIGAATAASLAQQGARVMVVYAAADRPGGIDDLGRRASTSPLRRAGAPEDIAEVVAFLLSDESSYVTGQVISIDGGASIMSAVRPEVPARGTTWRTTRRSTTRRPWACGRRGGRYDRERRVHRSGQHGWTHHPPARG